MQILFRIVENTSLFELDQKHMLNEELIIFRNFRSTQWSKISKKVCKRRRALKVRALKARGLKAYAQGACAQGACAQGVRSRRALKACAQFVRSRRALKVHFQKYDFLSNF